MNLSAVYNYIASQLRTSVSLYSEDKELQHRYCRRIDLHDSLPSDLSIKEFLFETCNPSSPTLSTINNEVTYALVQGPQDFYLIGPVYTDPSAGIKHCLNDISYSDEFLSSLTYCSISFLLTNILLLHNLINDPELSLLDCYNLNCKSDCYEDQVQRDTSSLIFDNRETNQKHKPYDQELRQMASIEDGDTDRLKASWNEDYSGYLGISSKDPIRNGKNLAISVIVLTSRAAIRGGLLPETAYSLCDSYMMQIEELTDMGKLEPLVKNAEYTFTQMVKETKEARRAVNSHDTIPIIENCKNYVFSHLHSKLTVQEIAENLSIHPNYLTSLFRKQEGVSLYQYILKQKINLTKNLLTYSPYSYIDIANYLGFTSQSHLGKHFKELTGYTLKEYRNLYGKRNYF